MGGVNSCWLPRYQNPNMVRENHTSTPKVKGHRRNLSAAFNLAEMERDVGMEQLNINTATEEELMTLPGINRDTAHNIVEYRRQIGGFKKVEDLALVSMVGATKLNLIRMEICVGRKKSSQSSSRSSSRNDLSGLDNASKTSVRSQNKTNYFVKVNVNTSNVFQLMKVKDITQVIAQNIVAYRDRKGSFRTLDDLVKVKGINGAILSAIRPHLVLTGGDQPAPVVNMHLNGGSNLMHTRTQSFTNGVPGGAMHSNAPFLGGSQDDLLNMYGPISRKSFRSKRTPPLFKQDGQPVIRVATWNVEGLDEDKAENPGVKEVLSMTALEQGWSAVGIQGLKSLHALQKICDELNRPTLPNVKKWLGRRGCWRVVMSQNLSEDQEDPCYLGFLYDASQDMELVSSSMLDPPGDLQGQVSAFSTHFKVRNQDIVLVNVYFSRSLNESSMRDLVANLQDQLKECEDDNVFILGDVSDGEPNQVTSLVEPEGYNCIECGKTGVTRPNSRVQLLCSKASTNLKTVKSGVITEGLTNPWIPDGWRWGGAVSRHAPLWCELVPSSSLGHLNGHVSCNGDS